MLKPRFKSMQRLIPLWEGRLVLIVTGLCLTIAIAVLLIFPPRFIQQTELYLYDTMLAGRTTSPKTTVPVMVGIDDASLKAYGQWPWPRYRIASLVQKLRSLGAEVIALDFIMPEPDRTSPEIIMAERLRDLGITPGQSRATPRDSNSERLAEAMAGGKVILGGYFEFHGLDRSGAAESPVIPAGMVVSSATASTSLWPRPTGMLRSMPLLTSVAAAEGFTNARHDLDGVLRRAPVLLGYQGRFVPSLALSAVLLASPDRRLSLLKTGDETELVWGSRHMPLDRNGNLMIDFRSGKKSFSYFSAKEILSGNKAAESLQGKIVLVGVWAMGQGDTHHVPTAQTLNGLEVHATIIDNILAGAFVSRPGWTRGAELAAILILGGLSTLLLSRSGFLLALLTVAVSVGGCYLGSRELLLSAGVVFSPLLPMATPLVIMTALSLLKYEIEASKVRQRNSDLVEAQNSIIFSMSVLAEERDAETGKHLLRTKNYVEVLARYLATLPGYAALDEADIELLARSAPLHDIGKIGIPDEILHKPGPLSPEEYAIIQQHTVIGARSLTKTIGGTDHPQNLDFLMYAQQMAESHHERWDGNGYPHGLKGADIPLAGRLMALADVYDALVSKRVYKRAFSHAEAQEFIVRERGRQFDPDVIDAFIANRAAFTRIAAKYSDDLPPEN